MKKSLTIILVAVVVIVSLAASTLVYLLNNSSGASSPTTNIKPPATYSYRIVATYPHDPNAFTEGLTYSDGYLYESTGLYGQSSLRQVDLTSGQVIQQVNLSNQYFGEGIAIVNNTIIQLTWQSHIGFVYDKNNFALLSNFTYPTEGWGLTYNGTELIMSDGTSNLYFLNPTTFQQTGEVQVHDGNSSITEINELEYVNGTVYANIWHTNNIAKINPSTGQVEAWINLAGLAAQNVSGSSEAVLNGIAYDQQTNRLFVTGKDWANLYQIDLVPT
jgi:glutamine cyclotransferase